VADRGKNVKSVRIVSLEYSDARSLVRSFVRSWLKRRRVAAKRYWPRLVEDGSLGLKLGSGRRHCPREIESTRLARLEARIILGAGEMIACGFRRRHQQHRNDMVNRADCRVVAKIPADRLSLPKGSRLGTRGNRGVTSQQNSDRTKYVLAEKKQLKDKGMQILTPNSHSLSVREHHSAQVGHSCSGP